MNLGKTNEHVTDEVQVFNNSFIESDGEDGKILYGCNKKITEVHPEFTFLLNLKGTLNLIFVEALLSQFFLSNEIKERVYHLK